MITDGEDELGFCLDCTFWYEYNQPSTIGRCCLSKGIKVIPAGIIITCYDFGCKGWRAAAPGSHTRKEVSH